MSARGRMSAPALAVMFATLSMVAGGGRISDPARIEQARGIAPRDHS